MIKLIAMDLDNTLLKKDRSISGYTLEVLEGCRKRGIAIAIATARSTQASSPYTARVCPDARVVYGGALALVGDQVAARHDLPMDTSRRLMGRLLSDPDVYAIYAINEAVALSNNPAMKEDPDFSHYQYTDFSALPDRRFLKISADIRTEATFRRIASEFPDLDSLRYTGEDLCRFSSAQATKWPALSAIAAHLGITTEEIAAFGDDLNDLEMLRECGMGVAVLNAVPEVQAVAKSICPCNDEDGVARWLEAHVLA